VIPLHDENPTSRRAIVTLAIIAACIVVYLFVQPSIGSDTAQDVQFDYDHAAVPYELSHGRPLTNCQVFTAVGSSQAPVVCRRAVGAVAFSPGKSVWLSVLYSMFFHGSWLHIAGNLLFLWVFGNNVEDRLGHAGFALFYLAAGVAATAAQVAVDVSSTAPMIGASGAIAGVMGAYLVWFPRAKVNTLFFVIIIVWFKIQARWILLAWFVLQFFTSPNSGVAWVAHVGGFVFGVVVGLLFRPRRRQPALNPWSPPPW
jgi:membrane associated rhomboid family serine protease